ncbi:Teneurin-2, partial [Dissostichus eleginoides]
MFLKLSDLVACAYVPDRRDKWPSNSLTEVYKPNPPFSNSVTHSLQHRLTGASKQQDKDQVNCLRRTAGVLDNRALRSLKTWQTLPSSSQCPPESICGEALASAWLIERRMYPWRALTANLHVTQMSPVRPPGAEETEPQVLLQSKETTENDTKQEKPAEPCQWRCLAFFFIVVFAVIFFALQKYEFIELIKNRRKPWNNNLTMMNFFTRRHCMAFFFIVVFAVIFLALQKYEFIELIK